MTEIGRYATLLVLVMVLVGLPALFRRSRIRAWQRNERGACGRCGMALAAAPVAYMEGFRVCVTCAGRLRRRSIFGLGFIGLFTATAVVASLFAIGADARRGTPDPWWAYLIVLGILLGLAGLVFFVLTKTRTLNRQAAERDATLTRCYDDDGEYQP